MKRREFIAATATLLVSSRRSRAQGTRRRLGVLVVGTTVDIALVDGLRNHGWIDGRNLIIEYRYAQSQERLPASAAELVALSPDLLIAVGGPQSAVALKWQPLPFRLYSWLWPIQSRWASSKAYRVQAAT